MTTAETLERPACWKSAGLHLLANDRHGRLVLTPDFLRAYYTRPEIHPIDDSCPAEHALFEALMEDPLRPVAEAELDAIADPDARDNYRAVLRWRALLAGHPSIEAAYVAFARAGATDVPPVFIDQLVHVLLAHMLRGVRDPMRFKAAEPFFREQRVSIDDGRIMLADEEIVAMYAETGGMGGLGALLVEAATPMREVTLDVITEDNKQRYWARSDRFDMVMDFRFAEPAQDAFARVMETWIGRLIGVAVRIQPVQSIKDERWSWHIGLDREATRILNALYEGAEASADDMARIIALFRMDVLDEGALIASMRGKPIYLGLAVAANGRLVMKPQNLVANMPLKQKA